MSKIDFYLLLEITREASESEIKAAYRKAALKHHPDRNPGDSAAEEKFKEVSQAYEVLSDSQKRQIYDTYGHEGLSGQGFRDSSDIFSSFGNIFEEFFGFSQGGSGGKQSRGVDLEYELKLTFEESVFGCNKDIEFYRRVLCGGCKGSGAKNSSSLKQCRDCGGHGRVRRSQGFFSVAVTCPTCQGEGKIITDYCKECSGKKVMKEKKNLNIKVPAGVHTGLRLRMNNEGEQNGNLYINIQVQENPRYERDGVNIHISEPLSFVQAALGCEVEIETLDGKQIIPIPQGSQYGDEIPLKNLGIPSLRSGVRGDFIIHLKVEIPRKLSKEQREILENFAKVSEISFSKHKGGFFNKIFE